MGLIKDRIIAKIVDTELIFDDLFKNSGALYTFLNPVSYLDAKNNEDVFLSFDGVLCDGILLVKAIKFTYCVNVRRCSFDMTSLAPKFFEYAIVNNKSVYVVASREKETNDAISFLVKCFPGLNVVGHRNGYFKDDMEVEETISKIIEMSPDFLIVGMGIVIQEKFLLRAKQNGYKGIGFTCGGFIHQTSKKIYNYYPKWVDRCNVRFLYRMLNEPHTRRRYMRALFRFPVVFLREKLKYK